MATPDQAPSLFPELDPVQVAPVDLLELSQRIAAANSTPKAAPEVTEEPAAGAAYRDLGGLLSPDAVNKATGTKELPVDKKAAKPTRRRRASGQHADYSDDPRLEGEEMRQGFVDTRTDAQKQADIAIGRRVVGAFVGATDIDISKERAGGDTVLQMAIINARQDKRTRQKR